MEFRTDSPSGQGDTSCAAQVPYPVSGLDTESGAAECEHLGTQLKVYPPSIPRACLPEFRHSLFDRYPSLADAEYGLFYRRLLHYLLYSNFLDQETGLQVLPRTTVAACAGYSSSSWGFSAQHWMDRFGAAIFPLHYSAWSWEKARTIDPEVPPDLMLVFLEQCSRIRLATGAIEVVDFVTGERISCRGRERRKKEYVSYLDATCGDPVPDHPAFDLVQLLNGAAQVQLRKIVRSNWAEMCDWVDRMPVNTDRDLRRAAYVARQMWAISELGILLRYDTSEATPRIYAVGANINNLPRELRKIALCGTVALDLRAAQLAIVSKVYDTPRLYEFLATGGDFWQEIISFLHLDRSRKQLIKNAIYAICFGMGRRKYQRLLCTGASFEGDRITDLNDDTGLGPELMQKFLQHPLVEELVRQRQKAMRLACVNGGAFDAFGQWQKLRNNYPPSLLANIAQSYEVRIMLSMLPIIKSERGISMISFLHDGVYLHFTDKSEQARQLRRIRAAVSSEAARLDVPTSFE